MEESTTYPFLGPTKSLPSGDPPTIETEVLVDQSDEQLARKTLRGLIQKGEVLLDNITKVAEENDRARDFEVAGQILEKVAKIAVDLEKATTKTSKKPIKAGDNTNIFFGSTFELIRTLRRSEEQDKEELVAEEDVEIIEESDDGSSD